MPKEAILLHNPNAGSALPPAELERLASSIRQGSGATLNIISEATEALALERLASSLDDQLVYVIGGDGTIGLVADLLVRTRSEAAIAPLPSGTGNDLCSHLGLSSNPFEAIGQLSDGALQKVDVGQVTWRGLAEEKSRVFINSWGMGFDASAASRSDRYKRLGTAAYGIAAAEVLLTWKQMRGEVRIDGVTMPASSYMFVSVCNGSSSGGGFTLAPHASLTDGMLNYFFVERISRLRAAMLLPTVRLTGRTSFENIGHGETFELTIESAIEQPMHFDGEVPDELTRSVTVRCLPGVVSLLTPGQSRQS